LERVESTECENRSRRAQEFQELVIYATHELRNTTIGSCQSNRRTQPPCNDVLETRTTKLLRSSCNKTAH